MSNSMANMATQSCCHLCEGHTEEWKIAQSTLSVLRSEVDELRMRESKAIQEERCAKEQLHASLRRQQELFHILDEVKRENLALRASVHSNQIPVHAASAEPPRISQDTAEMLPQTPAQLIPFRSMSHGIPGNADLTVEISALGEVNGGLAPSSGNFETLDSRVVSQVGQSLDGLTSDVGPISPLKVVEAIVLPVIPEVQPFAEISSNPGTGCDDEVEGGDIEEVLSKLLEPRIQEGDIHQIEKESQSYETQPKPFEAIDCHTDHTVSSSDERPANLGSHKKRRQLNLVQVLSDEDEDHVASPPSQEKLFKSTEGVSISGSQFSDELAASSGSHRKRRRNLVLASSDNEDEDYVASPPSKKKLFKTSFDNLQASNVTPLQNNTQQRGAPESLDSVGIVGMEFECGINVSELVTEDPEMDGKVTPKHNLHRLRRIGSVELQGCADATEQPLEVGLRRSKRLSQSSPLPPNEIEDEIESSDADSDSFVRESSAESSESSKLETRFEGPSNVIDLSDSDSESGPLTRRARSTRTASGTQRQGEESSESPQNRSSSGRPSFPTVVNLLKPSSDDEEEYDSDDGHDSLGDFIVHESSSSEESVSNGDEQMSDSDSGERESGSQGTLREEIVRKRQNLIWDFEGDMLAAIQTNAEIALQAICALYRQQTEDEQSLKGVLHRNGRGFDKMNSLRGSNFAEFLVDGDPCGQLKKSARALQRRFPGALKICQNIAAHHSKQLFEIYSNNEDPFWRRPTG